MKKTVVYSIECTIGLFMIAEVLALITMAFKASRLNPLERKLLRYQS